MAKIILPKNSDGKIKFFPKKKGSSIIANFSAQLHDTVPGTLTTTTYSKRLRRGMGSASCGSDNICYALLWLLLLWFIAWPIAFFASGLWVFLMVRTTRCMLYGHYSKRSRYDQCQDLNLERFN